LVALRQKINLFDKTVISWLGGITLFIVGVLFYLKTLDKAEIETFSKVWSNLILLIIIVGFVTVGLWKKVNIFDSFIEGAKGGFETAVRIIPYLVGMLVAISCFRNSGALNFITDGMALIIGFFGVDTAFVEALPVAIMKPLSGSGARGLLLDLMEAEGADAFASRVASIFQGSADTTFYIVALYFGSVGVSKIRYAIQYGLLADLIGVVAGIFIGYFFFA
jgi:spore maturation protein SpmB